MHLKFVLAIFFGLLVAVAVAYPAESLEQDNNEKELVILNADDLQSEAAARKTRQFFGGGFGGYGGYGGFGFRRFGFGRFGGYGGYGGYGGFGGFPYGGFGGGYYG